MAILSNIIDTVGHWRNKHYSSTRGCTMQVKSND